MLKEISIILPLHNKGHIIEKTIDQIYSSGLFEKCEVLVVENESTDDSLRKIEKIQKQYLAKLDIKLLKTQVSLVSIGRIELPIPCFSNRDTPFFFSFFLNQSSFRSHF
jgi:glycosyltransferase involved in cell wall biosynthesis